MNVKFTVGEFAALHKISKQTLIYYDNIGLLHPKMVNEETGYRYYTTDQFEDMDSILMLKEMGIPLKAIQEFLLERDAQSTLELLTNHKKKLQDKMNRLKVLEQRLDEKICTIQQLEEETINSLPKVKQFARKSLFIRDVLPPNDPVATDIELKRLLKQAMDEGVIFNYQIGVMINKDNLRKGSYLTTEKVFTTVRKYTGQNHIIQMGGCQCACIFHRGRYDKIAESYDKVLAFIEENELEIVDYSYEFCVLDNLTTSIKDEYLTEIVIPVMKK